MKGWMGKFRALIVSGLLALVLAGCGKENLTALKPKGPSSQISFDLIILTTVVMALVLLSVIIVYIIVLIRFRRKKVGKDFEPKQVEGHKKLETIWTIIPIILLIIISVPTTIATFDLASTEGAEDQINIDVTGNQYWWHFDYEDEDIQTSQDLYVPTGEKVFLNLKSSDVIHSFWVPSLAGKMDVNPENENTMYIEVDEEGVYYGKCAEFCGPSHSLMDFKIIAVDPDDYDEWVDDMKDVDSEELVEGEKAEEGEELFEENNCMSCHSTGDSNVDVGPNLSDFGNRTKVAGVLDHTKENVKEWIMDPESIKPGNKMTDNYPELSDDDADKIAEYLMELKPSDVTPESVGYDGEDEEE